MRILFESLINLVASMFKSRRSLRIENFALRQQLTILQRSTKRPNLRFADRVFWVILSKIWQRWKEVLIIVQPETVIRWHREGFKRYWAKKNHKMGRPSIDRETRDLIKRMSRENSLWGAPRIHGELLKLGISISQATISKLMVHHRTPPSQTWRTFLKNHMKDCVSIDFFTVPTANFQVLYVFLVLSHHRRELIHFNVTNHPTATWTAQQITEAFPWDTAPKYLIRDRDAIYGQRFRNRVNSMGINQVVTAARSPWQNPYVERVIGSIRRECLNHVIVFNDKHLRRLLRDYVDYYNHTRTHLSLNGFTRTTCYRFMSKWKDHRFSESGWTASPLHATGSIVLAKKW